MPGEFEDVNFVWNTPATGTIFVTVNEPPASSVVGSSNLSRLPNAWAQTSGFDLGNAVPFNNGAFFGIDGQTNTFWSDQGALNTGPHFFEVRFPFPVNASAVTVRNASSSSTGFLAACDRLTVSAAFFGSPEFRLKGFYVFTFYRVAFARLANYAEIIPDMRSVTGQTADEVYVKRAAFADSFAARAEFRNLYDARSNADYVAALLARYNTGVINTTDPQQPDTGAQVTLTQTELVSRLNAGTLTRAQVLRAVVQSQEVSNAEFNNAFVAMQYYGYLRRTPEPNGYQAWLNYLSAHPDDFRTMVNGFLNSTEYRLRFGNPDQ